MEKKEKNTKKNVGFNLIPPEKTCAGDRHCPFHGTGSNVRGRSFVGKVLRAKIQKNALVEIEGKRYVPKFERYTKVRTRFMVHNPVCIDAKVGDKVMIYETRKMSKTKNFVIVKIIQLPEHKNGTQSK